MHLSTRVNFFSGNMQRSAAVFVAALGLFAQAQGMELTKASFASEVKDSGKNAFIKFLAPWCAACLDRLDVECVRGSISWFDCGGQAPHPGHSVYL